MSEKNDTSQFQPRKSELFDTKNRSSITLSQKPLISSDRKVRFRYPKITDTFKHSINDHSMSEKNDTSQYSVSTSGSKNGTNQNSLTRRIIRQLRCLRKLLFHETENFIFAKLTLQLTIPLIILYEH